MIIHRTDRNTVCNVIVCMIFVASASTADAGFTISINGVAVVSDNGAGDSNQQCGAIQYSDTIAGWNIVMTTSIHNSPELSGITTSQLLVRNVQQTGLPTGPLVVTISDTFDHMPASHGEFRLTDSLAQSSIGSRRVTSSSDGEMWPDQFRGMEGVESGTLVSTAQGDRLTQTVTINGIPWNNGIVITASSFAESGGASLPPEGSFHAPSPSSLALLTIGVGLLSLYRWRASHRLKV